MTVSTSASVTIALFAIAIFVMALRLHGRVHLSDDFALARHRLPAKLTGLSQAFNALPVWMCLAIMTTAFSIGLGAIWLGLAMVVGAAVNWWLVAPYLRRQTTTTGSDSLSAWFAATAGDKLQRATLRSAAVIAMCALGLAAITTLQWAALQIASLMGLSFNVVLPLTALILLAIALLSGFWSASASDSILAVAIVIAYFVVAVACIVSLDSVSSVWTNLADGDSSAGRWFGGYEGLLSISMVTGSMFAAFGSAAQPHVVSRYLACRDENELRHARWLALAWTIVAVVMLLIIGWSGRVLLHDTEVANSRALITSIIETTLPGSISGIARGTFAIALAVTSLSLWVSMASHITADLRQVTQDTALNWSRVGVVIVAILVTLGAFYLPSGKADRFWFAWQSVAAAFGPLLLVRLTGKRVRPGSSLGAMWSGFVLTILFHLMPDTPGDLLERSLPFIAALGIALSGGERRRNPDRADRGDKTVHDHLPI